MARFQRVTVDSAVRRGEERRPFALVLSLAAATVVLIATMVLWIRHNVATTEPPAPNPAAFAHSTAVLRADRIDTSWADQQFAALSPLAGWLQQAGRSVLDSCSVGGSGGALFGDGSGYQFSCDRADTRYYVYGGPKSARIRQLEQALGQLGWGTFALVPATAASPVLPVISASLIAVSGNLVGKAGLQFSWAELGGTLDLGHDLGAVPPLVAPQRNVYLQAIRPPASTIVRDLTVTRPYLLIITVTMNYAERDSVSPSPGNAAVRRGSFRALSEGLNPGGSVASKYSHRTKCCAEPVA